jgi:hypothetical protein
LLLLLLLLLLRLVLLLQLFRDKPDYHAAAPEFLRGMFASEI